MRGKQRRTREEEASGAHRCSRELAHVERLARHPCNGLCSTPHANADYVFDPTRWQPKDFHTQSKQEPTSRNALLYTERKTNRILLLLHIDASCTHRVCTQCEPVSRSPAKVAELVCVLCAPSFLGRPAPFAIFGILRGHDVTIFGQNIIFRTFSNFQKFPCVRCFHAAFDNPIPMYRK